MQVLSVDTTELPSIVEIFPLCATLYSPGEECVCDDRAAVRGSVDQSPQWIVELGSLAHGVIGC